MGKSVAVIGVGALGRRHLQSISQMSRDTSIYAVEKNNEAVSALKEEFKSLANVKILDEISELPEELDVVVIATSSNARRLVFDQLIDHSIVHNIIFEKVLFQRMKDYEEVLEELQKRNIKAWVNCARREWTSYEDLKKEIEGEKSITISITGGSWGLACNGIHMLDLVSYLSGSEDQMNVNFNLKDEIVNSKRAGFYEVFGSIYGSCGKCEAYTISCFNNSSLPIKVEIATNSKRYTIWESRQKVIISSIDNEWLGQEEVFTVPYQSQLTQRVVEKIINTGGCDLATFEESARLHLKFIAPLIEHFEKNGMEEGICPIT